MSQIQQKSQSGRSMVEMLGVLAIIGVLSIGGIVGYRYAMTQHQANEIINDVLVWGASIQGLADYDKQEDYTVEFEFKSLGTTTKTGHPITAQMNGRGEDVQSGLYQVSVSNVSQEVCENVIQNIPEGINGMAVNDPEADNVICEEGDDNEIFFFFGLPDACYDACLEMYDNWVPKCDTIWAERCDSSRFYCRQRSMGTTGYCGSGGGYWCDGFYWYYDNSEAAAGQPASKWGWHRATAKAVCN